MTFSVTKRPKARLFLFLPVFLFLLAAPLLTASAPAQKVLALEPATRLEQQVKEWAAVLSAQKPFADWKDAVPDVQALGPGTHGWLAILKKDGQTIGYMVVQAVADGTFRLGEYGTGPNVLFSPASLAKSLLENGLIQSANDKYTAVRHYYHPFAAVWEAAVGKESYWIDAKTGELLPFDRKSWEKVLPLIQSADESAISPIESAAGIAISWMRKGTFDAYENLPWLTGKTPLSAQDEEKVQTRIRSGLHLRYVTEPYGDAALYALPVVGFQSWGGGRLDVALDMEGSRFIPIKALHKYGRFYE